MKAKYIMRAFVSEIINFTILVIGLASLFGIGLLLYGLYGAYASAACIIVLIVAVQAMIVYEKALDLKRKDQSDEQ